jgi:hypothetical protein
LHPYVHSLTPVAQLLHSPPELIEKIVGDLQESSLVARLSQSVADVSLFAEAKFEGIESFSLFRTMLYTVVRLTRPTLFIETGVLNGFSSAFILQAMKDNDHGRLISIDLPSRGLNLDCQGTADLPDGKEPGWAIPEYLRARHELRLGRAERLLPEFVLTHGAPDIFMHDSDHSFTHMIMEVSLVWAHMEKGLVIADNVEQNDAFQVFARATGEPYLVVSSFDEPTRKWQHGLLVKGL